jgi:hypothetical protein
MGVFDRNLSTATAYTRCDRSHFVADDDDVAALLTADLEGFPANLLVRDGILRTTLVAFDLHARLSDGVSREVGTLQELQQKTAPEFDSNAV